MVSLGTFHFLHIVIGFKGVTERFISKLRGLVRLGFGWPGRSVPWKCGAPTRDAGLVRKHSVGGWFPAGWDGVLMPVFCSPRPVAVALEALADGVQEESSVHKAARCWYVSGARRGGSRWVRGPGCARHAKALTGAPEHVGTAIMSASGEVMAVRHWNPGPPAPSLVPLFLQAQALAGHGAPLPALPSQALGGLPAAHRGLSPAPAAGPPLRPRVALAWPHWLRLSVSLQLHADTLG